MKLGGNLSKREHQIMDLAYERGELTATDLVESLTGNLSNSAVRSYLRALETKGFLRHEQDGVRFVYRPVRERGTVAKVEANRLLNTFFGGSVTEVLATLLSDSETKVSDEELEEMRRLIEQARKS